MTSKRTTVVCKDLDEMIDLVEAWHQGRFAAVREAIRNPERKQDMPEEPYNNENRVALWPPRDTAKRKGYYTGGGPKSGFCGDEVRSAILVVVDNPSPKAPFAEFWWATDKGTYRAPIFNNDGKLGGSIDSHWVNVYKNEKGPPLTVTFKEKEPTVAGASSQPAEAEDDLPF